MISWLVDMVLLLVPLIRELNDRLVKAMIRLRGSLARASAKTRKMRFSRWTHTSRLRLQFRSKGATVLNA